jgi:hypothetical protein
MNIDKKEIIKFNASNGCWNIGTNPDKYLKNYILLSKYCFENKVERIDIEKLHNLINLFTKEISKSTLRQNIDIFYASDLIFVEENDIVFKIVSDELKMFDIEKYIFDAIMKDNINHDSRTTKGFWLSVLIANLFKNGTFSKKEVLQLNGFMGKLKESFFRNFFKKYNVKNCLYVNNMDDVIIDALYLNLIVMQSEKQIKNPSDSSIIQESKPLDVNIEGSSQRDQTLQAQFRKELIDEAKTKNIDGCWICGSQTFDYLEAAHIIDWKNGGFDVDNGLLLCSNHHKHYDANNFKLDSQGNVLVNSKDIEHIVRFELQSLKLNKKALTEGRIKRFKEKL